MENANPSRSLKQPSVSRTNPVRLCKYIKLTPSGGYLTSDNILKLAGLRHCFLGMKMYSATLVHGSTLEPINFCSGYVVLLVLLKANAGALTNFEVLDFLRSRGAAKDPTRVIVSVAPSEFKIIEQCEKRLGESVEELVELVAVVFPAPAQTEPDEAAGEDNEEIPDGQQMDAS
ncbi:uncharacterized protein LOC130784719 isoform X1 [Actinidia eriantha]|uniref:uncharacterized protein LOC130784719 isoform X1 n=1 Tax=Actinidia eriantha TaxID=165200 RepID=UPI002590FF15|nr:uncharacterized protein LOC130784719 isoform X1 [Actinidia eriantha]